jgi:DNA-binding transcriptional ArsR family regulator
MMATVPLLEGLGMSRQAASKHLAVLETAGIVRSKPVGRVVYRELEVAPLAEAGDWLLARTKFWQEKLDRLEAFLDNP